MLTRSLSPSGDWATAAAIFLYSVWSLHQVDGYVFIGYRRGPDGPWHEESFDLGSLSIRILARWLRAHLRSNYDLYFCPNAFSRRTRKQKFALPTPFGWCDLDTGDAREFRPQPNILSETSRGRKQAFWEWDECLSVDDAEAASRALTRMAGG